MVYQAAVFELGVDAVDDAFALFGVEVWVEFFGAGEAGEFYGGCVWVQASCCAYDCAVDCFGA